MSYHGSNDPSFAKFRLLAAVREAKAQSKLVADAAAKIIEDATVASDAADAIEIIVQQVPNDAALPEYAWQQLTQHWGEYNDSARRTHTSISQTTANYRFTVPVTTAASSTAISTATIGPWLEVFSDPRAADAFVQLEHISRRYGDFDAVCAAYARLALDTTPAAVKSARTLLTEARDAFQAPVNPGSVLAVTMPLRQALLATIDRLLKRCAGQEKTPTIDAKILSIGRRAGRGEIDINVFHTLGLTARTLVEHQLSGVKDKSLDRHTLSRTYHDCLSFLNSLLDSVDPAKLRT